MNGLHRKLWDDFCAHEHVLDSPQIFESDPNLIVSVKQCGGKQRKRILCRSREMEHDLSSKAIAVRTDAQGANPVCQGLLYMMFWNRADEIIPLYIGKAEIGGRKHAISRLFTNSKSCPLPRWDDSLPYHIGGLSTWVCTGYTHQEKGKDKWAKKLFVTVPDLNPKLIHPVYLWVRIWRDDDVGLWPEYGPTSMCMQESILIDLAHRLYPNDILNTEGILR